MFTFNAYAWDLLFTFRPGDGRKTMTGLRINKLNVLFSWKIMNHDTGLFFNQC